MAARLTINLHGVKKMPLPFGQAIAISDNIHKSRFSGRVIGNTMGDRDLNDKKKVQESMNLETGTSGGE